MKDSDGNLIIGLSASGKTTLGKLMHDYLEAASGDKWILLDGDVLEIFLEMGAFSRRKKRQW